MGETMTAYLKRHLPGLLVSLLILPAMIVPAHSGGPNPQAVSLSLTDCLQETLVHDPQIQIQKQIRRIREGDHRSATGAFDPRLSNSFSASREKTPYSPTLRRLQQVSRQATTSNTWDVTYSRLLRNGMTFSPTLRLQRTDNQDDFFEPFNTARVQFNLNMPLLRGRHGVGVRAAEDSAWLELEAAVATTLHTISQRLYQTTLAYWSFLAARKNLDISRDAESHARKMLSDYRKLVSKDEIPAAELKQLEGYLTDRQADRINATQSCLEARHALALAMGRTRREEMDALNELADRFPRPGRKTEKKLPLDELIEAATAHRQDLKSLRKRLEAAAEQKKAARDATRRQLDLVVSAGYAGVEEGTGVTHFVDPLRDGIYGMNTSAQLRYDFAVNRRRELATLQQAEASQASLQLQHGDLLRTLQSTVTIARSSLLTSIESLVKAEKTIDLYSQALSNERQKVDLGMATLLDVMNTQDRLYGARRVQVNSQLRYAQALARLRYETGLTLQPLPGDAVETLDMKTIPENDELTVR